MVVRLLLGVQASSRSPVAVVVPVPWENLVPSVGSVPSASGDGKMEIQEVYPVFPVVPSSARPAAGNLDAAGPSAYACQLVAVA